MASSNALPSTGLLEISLRPERHALIAQTSIVVRGNHDNRRRIVELPETLQQLDAGHAR